MKKAFGLGIGLLLLSLASSVHAQVIDLDHDGVPDGGDDRVFITTNESLPAGEYSFSELVVTEGATLTLEGDPASVNDFKGVKISADTIIVDPGSAVSADNEGYSWNEGPGMAPLNIYYSMGGAGHGGVGAYSCSHGFCRPGGPTYGSSLEPKELGSDNGGGAIWLAVSGVLVNNGTISADGGVRGSGGSILIDANHVAGEGVFSAQGGDTMYDTGGGGRIAIRYGTSTFVGTTRVDGSIGAGDGTACFVDVVANDLYVKGSFSFVSQDNTFVFNDIVITDGAVVGAENGAVVRANELTIDSSAKLSLWSDQTLVVPMVTVMNGGRLTLSGNEVLDIETMNVRDGASIEHVRGGRVFLDLKELFIDETSRIVADERGYITSQGPGVARGGAGHGGYGATICDMGTCYGGGPAYGSSTAPIDPGSDNGGGVICIVADTFVNDGIVSANGSWKGSGGSVFVTTRVLEGEGVFRTDGDQYGYGAGGRIAIYFGRNFFNGLVTASGYRGAENGTIVFEQEGSAPVLSFSDDMGYDDDGIHPNKGVANKDILTFKTVYASETNTTPQSVRMFASQTAVFDNAFYGQLFSFAEEDQEKLVFKKDSTIATDFSPIPVGGHTLVGYDAGLGDMREGFDDDDTATIEFWSENVTNATTTLLVRRTDIPAASADVVMRAVSKDGVVLDTVSSHVELGEDEKYRIVPLGTKFDQFGAAAIARIEIGTEATNETEVWLTDVGVQYGIDMEQVDVSDTEYTDGAQFVVTLPFPKGVYAYHFAAQDENGHVGIRATDEDGELLSFTTGYSSVAFLPGLEASRLYKPGLTSFTEDQLWYPNTLNDLDNLALSATTGESLDPNIYTRDVLDEVAGTVNIYKSFLSEMNGLVESGTISRFEPLPYDWRKDQKDVATKPVVIGKNGENYSMTQKIEELAATSQTGKVTIITHSNGGLVAKELIEDLRVSGEEGVVDQLIMVAAPELGTPKAVLSLLHGEDFFGAPNYVNTREMGENMKSAYALLPSRSYFDRIDQSLREQMIEFSTTTPTTQYFRDIYGNNISDYDTLQKFLLGEYGLRTEPAADAVNEPNVLKGTFISNAEELHEFQDTWNPPEGIEVTEIVGWGLDTVNGIRYDSAQKKVCNEDLSACIKQEVIDPRPLVTVNGDGTVVNVSAEATEGAKKYWVEIDEYNKGLTKDRDHKNILEIEPLVELVSLLVQNNLATLPDYIKSMKPILGDGDSRLRIGVHSPVTLHLYDGQGHHTGPATNLDPNSGLPFIEEQIPNSYYWQIGEGQYAGVGVDSIKMIWLVGKELGTFTVDIEKVVGGNVVSTDTFANIPTTQYTTASILTNETVPEPTLLVDVDGDGVNDVEISSNEELSDEDFFTLLRGIILTLDLPEKEEKRLIKAVDSVLKHVDGGDVCSKINNISQEKINTCFNQRSEKKLDHLVKVIKNVEEKELISLEEAENLIKIIGDIER